MNVELIPRADGAGLLPVRAEYDVEPGDVTFTKRVYVDRWPRLVLLDDYFLRFAEPEYVEHIDEKTIRITVENGSALYRFVRYEGGIISLWEGAE